MQKRQLIINGYKTAEDGLFTLAACKVTKAAQVQNFVSVPGRFAPLDLSTVLTDGEPCYENASLEAVLESSEGTRDERQERIDRMKNLLDGYTAKIIHPDFPGKYLVGRVQVTPDFNGLSYCSVAVSAVLEAWLYNDEETVEKSTLPHYEAGKNIMPYPFAEKTLERNGITYTDNGDGTITVNGTATAQSYFILWSEPGLPIGKYALSGCPAGGTASTYLMTGNGFTAVADRGSGGTLEVKPDSVQTNVVIVVQAGATVQNLVFKPKMEVGTDATPFKPYTTAGGKNLLDIPSKTVSGSHAYTVELVGDFELPSGTYTLSAQYVHKGAQIGQISVREYGTLDGYLNTATLRAGTSGEAKVTFTVPEGVQGIRIYLYSNVSATAGDTSVTISKVMVNEGSNAITYEPYYPIGDKLLTLSNEGRLAVVPVVDVIGSVSLTYGDKTRALSTGTYQFPDLYLTNGNHYVIGSGIGSVIFTYREAVLAG